MQINMRAGWEAELNAAVRPPMERLAELMLEGAHLDTPVDTGLLDSLNSVEVLPDSTIVLSNSADYAVDVEMGHHIQHGATPRKTADSGGFVHPRPFLRPQVYKNWGAI